MSDLNEPKARLLIARNELGVAEQRLVIKKRSLRIMEIDAETARVQAEITTVEAQIVELDKGLANIPKSAAIERMKAEIDRDERSVIIESKQLRLLELEDERRGVLLDIEASKDHITKLQAEVSQQQARLKESING